MMNKKEATFERNLSDQIVREVAKVLGFTHLKFHAHHDGPRAKPWITRRYGQLLILPQPDGWDAHVTVTVWMGKVNADYGRGVWDKAIYQTSNDGEFSYDAADPQFIDHVADKLREVINLGKPEL